MHPVLSFDVGIKNLAVCVLDKDSKQIQAWKVINLVEGNEKSLHVVASALIDHMDELVLAYQDEPEWTVLIENQPAFKNPTMKSIQMILYSYFAILQKHHGIVMHIDFIAASRKLRYMKEHFAEMDKSDTSYKVNKANAVAYTKQHLSLNDPSQLPFFTAHKKKDDLADCLLQALSFL